MNSIITLYERRNKARKRLENLREERDSNNAIIKQLQAELKCRLSLVDKLNDKIDATCEMIERCDINIEALSRPCDVELDFDIDSIVLFGLKGIKL